tara:strand:+ start:1421 stop:1891 length:471 start_codon:yes stop_codon:yes gene_type:complete
MKNKDFTTRLFFATMYRKLNIFMLRFRGYSFDYSVIIERNVKLDKLNPEGIHIGNNTLVASGSVILSHDHCKRTKDNQPYMVDTHIGKNCFIAINSIILPGVKIGNEVIVGAGSVVTKDVPNNCVVAGNPAKIIRTNIKMNDFAALENWNEISGWD